MERGAQSQLLKDPYVRRVWDLINGEPLFSKSADELASLRESLRRESLQFFARHSPYYVDLFDRLEIDPAKATLRDVAKLAIPSDMLRGDGQKRFLIQDLEEGGETFSSSGTTGKDPVRVYRSPVDLAIMLKANTDLFEHVYGDLLKDGEGVALFMAAPELRYKLSFVAFVDLTLDKKGIELLYGMDLEDKSQAGTPWQKLTTNKESLLKFLKSKKEPKLFFTAPAGVRALVADDVEPRPRALLVRPLAQVLDAEVGQRVGLVPLEPPRLHLLAAAHVRLVVVVGDVEAVPVLEPAPHARVHPEVLSRPTARRDHGGARLWRQVPLADVRRAVAGVGELVRDGARVRVEEVAVAHDAVDVRVLTRHEAGAERHAHRVVAVRVRAAHALSRQRVDGGRRAVCVTAAAERVVTELVGDDPQDVGHAPPSRLVGPRGPLARCRRGRVLAQTAIASSLAMSSSTPRPGASPMRAVPPSSSSPPTMGVSRNHRCPSASMG